MEPQPCLLIASLKNLFGDEDHSNCILEIHELSQTSIQLVSDKRNERKRLLCSTSNSEETSSVYCTIPVHSCILAMQSEYFKKMYESSMKESKSKTMILKVEKGECLFVKLFIQSLYDHNLFDDMNIYTFLSVIEIADRYSCDVVIQQAAGKLTSVKADNLLDCEKTVQRIAMINYGLSVMKETVKSIVKKCCTKVLSYFCPLEMKLHVSDENFFQLSFDMLVALLKCEEPIAYDESTILYYIVAWLEFDSKRQTENVIKDLLHGINIALLSTDFLIDAISESNVILNKWSGYKEWYIFAISFHAHSQKRPSLPLLTKTNNIYFKRNFEPKDMPVFYHLNFQKDEDNDFVSEDYFVYKGYTAQIEIDTSYDYDETGQSKDLKIEVSVLNINKEHQWNDLGDIILPCRAAIGLEGGLVTKKHFDSLVFKIIDENHCTEEVDIFEVCTVSRWVGRIQSICLEKWDSFVLYIAIIESDKAWPKYFPRHLRENPGAIRINY